jgi:hypothetical protein
MATGCPLGPRRKWPGRRPRGTPELGVVTSVVVLVEPPVSLVLGVLAEPLEAETAPKTTATGCPLGPRRKWPGRSPRGSVALGVVVLVEPPELLPVETVVIWKPDPAEPDDERMVADMAAW